MTISSPFKSARSAPFASAIVPKPCLRRAAESEAEPSFDLLDTTGEPAPYRLVRPAASRLAAAGLNCKGREMISKLYPDAAAALDGVLHDGMTI